MSNTNLPDTTPAESPELNESFDTILSQFEQSHSRRLGGAEGRSLEP